MSEKLEIARFDQLTDSEKALPWQHDNFRTNLAEAKKQIRDLMDKIAEQQRLLSDNEYKRIELENQLKSLQSVRFLSWKARGDHPHVPPNFS